MQTPSAVSHSAHRRSILGAMQRVMGDLPRATQRVAPAVKVLSEEKLPGFTRHKILLEVEKDDWLPAYLLAPEGASANGAAVLCLHQTTKLGKAEPAGVDGEPNLHYAAHLAARGYVTLAPDYSMVPFRVGYGEYSLNPYECGYASGTMKGVWNHMRAVDLLTSLQQVDKERIGCIGHSLGGHNALFLAAFDQRIKVAVSSCGFTSFAKYFGGDLSGWSSSSYMPRIATEFGNDASRMPFDFSDVIAAVAPHAVLAVAPTQDDFDRSGARDCVNQAQPFYQALGAERNLKIVHPECGHDFPKEAREVAYNWIDHHLANSTMPANKEASRAML